MVIYGRDISLIYRGKLVDEECPRCRAKHKLQMQVYCWYSHIYFIPVRPKRKIGALTCLQCGARWYERELPFPALEMPLYELRKQSKYKLKNYIGLFIFGIPALILLLGMIGLFSDNNSRHDTDEGVEISKLQTDDVLYVKLGERKFTTWRVGHLAGDTVFIYENKLTTNLSNQLNSIDDSANYQTDETWFYKKEMVEFVNSKKIFDIDSLARFCKNYDQNNQ